MRSSWVAFVLTAVLAMYTTGHPGACFTEDFSWAGGIEDTFIPQSKPGLRPLEEYELTQHYTQWREDLDKAKSLGITKLRWGVPWYRVEKTKGVFDWKWVDEVLNYMINKLHIDPIIDLIHYGTPEWMTDSFADPKYPEYAADYARAFAKRYGKMVKYYTPLNEPSVNADQCGRLGLWPPYLKGESGYMKVLTAIALGIQLEGKAIREEDPDAQLVAVEAMRNHHATAAETKGRVNVEFEKDFLPWDLVSGKVDKSHPLYGYVTEHGVTGEELNRLKTNGIVQDIFGVNFYPWSSTKYITDPSGIKSAPGPDDGRQLTDVMTKCYEHAQRPLFVTETSATGDLNRRALWMAETIDAVRLVRDKGIPVVGYTWFPLITMVEWEYRTDTKPVHEHLLHLGLWDSSFDDKGVLVRKPTPLVETYKDWIRRGMDREAERNRRLDRISAPK